MNALYNFSRQIAQLRKEKKYAEALAYFKENKVDFDKTEIAENEYIVSDILTSLRQTDHFEAGFQFLHHYEIEIGEHTPEIILTAYAWLLYDNFKEENDTNGIDESDHFTLEETEEDPLQDFDYDKSELIVRIETAIRLLQRFTSKYSKSALEFLFKIVLKAEKKRVRPAWPLVVEFCDNVDPGQLSTECDTIQVTRKGKLQDMELASTREEWYAYMSKALFEVKNYQRCYDISKQALGSFDKFHYSYDVWFARRIALCKREMGQVQEAVAELEVILKKKREWFILKELAEIYLETGQTDKAMLYAAEGMRGRGELEFKVELIELLGQLYQRKGERETAYLHFTLVRLIREDEGWRVPDGLVELLNTFAGMQSFGLRDKASLLERLKPVWGVTGRENSQRTPQQSTSTPGQRLSGSVKKILNSNENGVNGFIREPSGSEVYFFVSADHRLANALVVGTMVEFEKVPAANGKGDKAIKLQLAGK